MHRAAPTVTLPTMSTVTFDTFKFVERLEKAGLSRDQAAAIVEAQKDSLAEALDATLATKADIVGVKNDIARLDARIDTLELRLTVKLGALMALSVGMVATLIKLWS